MTVGTDTVYVQSPNGFRVNDRIIVNAKNGDCELTQVTAVTPGDSLGNVTTGMVGLSHAGAHEALQALRRRSTARASSTWGRPASRRARSSTSAQAPARATRPRTVSSAPPTCSPTHRRSRSRRTSCCLKAQYGVDCAGNGVITWTSATASGVCGLNYTPDDFMPPAPGVVARGLRALLARIRAVRIAIVVRSDEPDLKDPALVGQTATLFDCSAHTAAACQGWIPITNAVLQDGWRHRTYETIVPMRNAIYNNGT